MGVTEARSEASGLAGLAPLASLVLDIPAPDTGEEISHFQLVSRIQETIQVCRPAGNSRSLVCSLHSMWRPHT